MPRLRIPRRLLFIPPILLGVIIIALVLISREPPARREAGERAVPARVIPLEPMTIIPRAIGQGTSRPATEWEAVSEVGGHIVEVHPRFEAGESIPRGSVLLRIDPVEYELAVASASAERAQIDAQLAELDVREQNLAASMTLERQSLELAERDLARSQELREEGTVSVAMLEEQQTQTLAQRLRVQEMENAQRLIPAQRHRLEAERDRADVRLAQASRDLAHTVIRAPFDARLAETRTELDELVTPGQVLAIAHDVAATEVEAQFFATHMRHLIEAAGLQTIPVDESGLLDIGRLGLTAVVRVHFGDELVFTWEARVTRVSPRIDPQTRTIGIVAVVDQPYDQAVPGVKPPFVPGMFCEVELHGRPIEGLTAIPRAALHGDAIHLVDGENRLVRREADSAFQQGDVVALRGRPAGERLIVSDLLPAIEGQLIDPVTDDEALARLRAAAAGEAPLR